MPDTIRFLLVILFIVGLAWGTVWALGSFPPKPVEVTKILPNDKPQPK